jgi:branched-chain amino acid transport system substrate-binding protein
VKRIKSASRRSLLAALAVLAAACAPPPPPIAPAPDPRPPEVPREPVPVPPTTAAIGVIVPLTGSATMQQYGELVLQGVRLAIPPASGIELVVIDDRGDAGAAAALISELERRGVVAVIGPLLSEAVIAALRGRSDPELAILSPTASDAPPAGTPNAYVLNAGDAEGVVALAQHAVRTRMGRVAMLYAGDPENATLANAFRAALEAAGGRIVADVPYRTGTTTFAEQMSALRRAGPQAIFVAAPMRDIPQLAPQFSFYGLGGVPLLGSEVWAADELLRSLPARQLDDVITVTPLLPTSPVIAWAEFVGLYEAAHRRTLDNPYPALGYDAARLILGALDGGTTRRRDVARRLAVTRDYRGATGILSVRDGRLVRRPFVVRIADGRLVAVPGSD